ncbi:methyltransferase domain-containing protein [Roseomonas nepalensis]|uniref:Methyltransferase domain-containing protein n=1 Tax=Muricoccus nepalensis TaxID=1854500 RepID=A0A502FAH1_9PROT|nr:class I SAM-dependent methyltransferase [Roseomonas nepalensis]TPG46415.1 methyltransferase domain-containing protein [Roseomonas nepalensis]
MPIEAARPLSPAELQAAYENAIDGRGPLSSAAPPPAMGAAPAEVPAQLGQPLRIEALSRLDDLSFLQAAYQGLLQRPPDAPGLQHYTAELAAGRSRVLVLGELRYSAEGRRIATPVPGLRGRFLLHRAYRVRLLGRLLRVLTGIAALPGLLRDVARLGTELTGLTADVRALRAGLADAELRLQAVGNQARPAGRGVEQFQAAAAEVAALSRRIEGEPWSPPILELATQLDGLRERLGRAEARAIADEDASSLVREAAGTFGALRERMGWPQDAAALASMVEEALTDGRNLAIRAANAAGALETRVHAQESRLSLILHEARRLAPGTPLDTTAAVEQANLLDPLYVAFEDRFRGTRADIKQRQSVYLDTLRAAGAGTAARPIVDVGSGRGELLELLRDEGLHARGVDLNGHMVALCTAAGLDCTKGDAVAYLAGLEPGSLGAVTGFHIIEHLPFPVMVALLDASLHALAPGGIIVFETPNPANLLVASRWFYLDPTHRNPLPGEMVAMIAEARGFVEVSIRPLHPMQARFEARDEVLARELDAIFHGPQDYALIARRP